MEKVKVKTFKIKLIIFTVICAMAAGIVVNAKIKNSNVIEINDKNEIKNKQLQECEIKNQADLEKRWKIGYDQFFEGEYAKAIATENQVLKEDSKFYKAYAVKGIALAYNGDFKGGMQQIDNSLKLKPDYGYARFNKALAYELYGYYTEAIKWYEKDLELEEYEWTYYGIASIYGRKGDINNTVKYLKLAIAINPNIKNEAKNEKDFENVKQYNQFKLLIEK
ncbi:MULTISPECIES: tetratricopeptide repeat protein [Clostridium]|uniref:Tetratricopeptide repeat-containing protein n=1 Tax=Clostridium frigoriphilum TaxID=443253 RepID=A0ABU7UNK8_9CLOT